MFSDPHVKAELEYVLNGAFHYVPAGVRSTGELAGYSYEGFWWREVAEDEDDFGTRGYIMVWWDGENRFNSNHTYHYPPEVFS